MRDMSKSIVALEDLTDTQWEAAHDQMYSLKLARHMGADPALVPPKPSLQEFYNTAMAAVEAGKFRAWALIDSDGTYLGHSILDKSNGEWEMGAAIPDESRWSSGWGVKLALHALRWAFEEDGADWVLTFATSTDPRVKVMDVKGGFKPFMHFHVMSRETWDAKWRSRMQRRD